MCYARSWKAAKFRCSGPCLTSVVSYIKYAFSGPQICHNKAYFAGKVDYLAKKYNAVVANLRATRRASRYRASYVVALA